MLSGRPDELCGMPLIRDGDNVYLINYQSLMPFDAMKEQMDRMALAWDEYRCPFSILSEFSQWWEWHKRLRFDGQSTGRIITSMLSDVERIKKHKVEPPFRLLMDYDIGILNPRAAIKNAV